MRKVFRVSRMSISKANEGNLFILRYKLEQRYGLILHFWGSPSFAPPHLFRTSEEALKCAKKHYPNCVVYDNYSGANTQRK